MHSLVFVASIVLGQCPGGTCPIPLARPAAQVFSSSPVIVNKSAPVYVTSSQPVYAARSRKARKSVFGIFGKCR
jgi:hypothetical protein